MFLWSSLLVKASNPLFWFVIASVCFFPCSSNVFFFFFFQINYQNRNMWTLLVLFFIFYFFLSVDNISSPVFLLRWCFAASLLISHFSFSSLVLSLIVMVTFYIGSKRFLLKSEELSDAGVVSIIKKEFGFSVHFL